MEYIEVTNKWLLAYKNSEIIINGFQSYAKVWYDITGNTNYELFDTEILMNNRIIELFPSTWQHTDMPIRISLPILAVIEKYSDKIAQLKSDGAPYYYYNNNNAIMIYLGYIDPVDLPILQADSDVTIENYTDYLAQQP